MALTAMFAALSTPCPCPCLTPMDLPAQFPVAVPAYVPAVAICHGHGNLRTDNALTVCCVGAYYLWCPCFQVRRACLRAFRAHDEARCRYDEANAARWLLTKPVATSPPLPRPGARPAPRAACARKPHARLPISRPHRYKSVSFSRCDTGGFLLLPITCFG